MKARNVISTSAQIRARIGRRGFAAAGLLLLALFAAVATPQLLGTRVAEALDTVAGADPTWLWLAGIGFAVSVLAAAGSWRCAIGLCGGRLSVADACARYGVGSFVNTIGPFRAGDAVRIGLFARVLPSEKRLLTTSGAFAALGAARAVVLGALVVAGYLAGAVPLWPLLVAVGLIAVAVAVAIASRRSSAHILDAFRSLASEPSGAARLVAWLAVSTIGRLISATAVGAALGLPHPLAAAIVIIPALDVAGLIPLTPGNIGITSGAIAIALQAQGTSFTNGLAAGIAFHAVETAVGLMFGIASLVWMAPYPSPGARRIALLAGTASWVLAIAGAFGATVLVPLV
jgi:glycosyltransferase 2 family protein